MNDGTNSCLFSSFVSDFHLENFLIQFEGKTDTIKSLEPVDWGRAKNVIGKVAYKDMVGVSKYLLYHRSTRLCIHSTRIAWIGLRKLSTRHDMLVTGPLESDTSRYSLSISYTVHTVEGVPYFQLHSLIRHSHIQNIWSERE